MTAPDKLTVEQWNAFDRVLAMINGLHTDDMSADEMRRKIYGEVLGMIPESFARHRQQAEARAEAILADAVARIDFITQREAPLVAALESIANMPQIRLAKEETSSEIQDIATNALTVYRSARPT